MSFAIKLSSLSKSQRIETLKSITVVTSKTQYEDAVFYKCFRVDVHRDLLYLPLGIWNTFTPVFPNGNSDDFMRVNKEAIFTKKLLTPNTDPSGRERDQVSIAQEALKNLEERGSTFLNCYTGLGKTALAIYLSIKLGLKTVILCHFNVIKKQWPEEFEKFTSDVRVQIVSGKNTKLHEDADTYIIGVKKASMMSEEDFYDIGTVIIDEAHLMSVMLFTDVLFKFRPRYLIGLSATPDNCVGGYQFLRLYFGHELQFITRLEHKDFTVYKYQTTFTPEVSYTMYKGKLVPDWNKIINSIESNEQRWSLIADIVVSNPKEKIIVLCNRKCLSQGVYNLLLKKGEDVELLIDKTQKWDTTARVLVAGIKKGGTGLNDPKLTMAIIASDTQDVRQYEGRIRCTNNIVYHLVDNYRTFDKHWNECRIWYEQKGADIKVIGNTENFIGKNIQRKKLL